MRILSALEIRALEGGLEWNEDDANASELERMHDKLVELGLMIHTRELAYDCECGGCLEDVWLITERGKKELVAACGAAMSTFDPNKFSCVTDHFGEDWCACAESEEKCGCEFEAIEGGARCVGCHIEVDREIEARPIVDQWDRVQS